MVYEELDLYRQDLEAQLVQKEVECGDLKDRIEQGIKVRTITQQFEICLTAKYPSGAKTSNEPSRATVLRSE